MTEDLDLLLVNPGARAQVYGKLGLSLSGIEPPLWCALIAAFVRERGYSVRIIDAEAEDWSPEDTAEKIAEENPRLAGIIVLGSNPSAASTPKMTAVGKLLRSLQEKAPQVITVLGGLHPSALPEMTLGEELVDYVAQGEGFFTVLEILEVLKAGKKPEDGRIPGLWYCQNGNVIAGPPAPLVNPDELPMAAWDLLPMGKYRAHNWHCFDHINRRQPYAFMFTSLGCPYNCSYCNIHSLYNDKPGIRFRSPEKVVEEIDLLNRQYGVKNIKFMDELFAIREDRVNRLCDLIIKGGYDLNIWAYARVDTVNESMLKRMKQAGINWLCYGFESASHRVRNSVAKKTEEEVTRRAIEMTRDAGIYILGNFIFGLPEDDLETMQATLDMARGYNFEYVNFYVAMAYPGSQLYRDAVRQGIRLPDAWHGYGQFSEEALPLPTKYLSPAEVLRFRDDAFREYFSNPRYLEMIRQKFGPEVVAHIGDMLKTDIRRKYAWPAAGNIVK
jgi:anaerobic magnesium-protoporphyrin IX monomethyl ester cyclase